MKAERFTCIECGHPVRDLFQRYQGDIIKVIHCNECGNVADRYIEYDAVLIMLDALLHKPQAYRHVLLNAKVQWEWKLLVILLLCGTYEKWESPGDIDTVDNAGQLLHAALEWQFYKLFLVSIIEWTVLCTSLLLMTKLYYKMKNVTTVTSSQLLRGVILSSFGRLFIIPAILWGQTHSATYLLLSEIFVFTSNIVAIKVLSNMSRKEASLIVILAHATRWISISLLASQ